MERFKSIIKWVLFIIGGTLTFTSFALSDMTPLWGLLGTGLGFMLMLSAAFMSRTVQEMLHENPED